MVKREYVLSDGSRFVFRKRMKILFDPKNLMALDLRETPEENWEEEIENFLLAKEKELKN